MSSIEETLEGLGQEARLEEEESELDAQLAAYAAGALSAEALAELRAKAATEPDLAASLQAYAPLDAAKKAAIVARVKSTLAAGAGVTARDSSRAPRSKGSLTRLVFVLAPALAAAAVVLLMLGRGEDEQSSALASYSVEVRRTLSERRSGSSEGSPAQSRSAEEQAAPLVTFDPQQAPVFILRPEQGVESSATAHVFVQSAGGLTQVVPQLERGEGGALRLELRDLERMPASGTLIVLVTQPELSGNIDRLREIASGEAGSGSGWQRFHFPYRTAGEPTRAP